MPVTTSSPSSRRRPVSVTKAPSSAKSSATARPIPLVPPVTRALLFFSRTRFPHISRSQWLLTVYGPSVIVEQCAYLGPALDPGLERGAPRRSLGSISHRADRPHTLYVSR